MRLFAEPSFIRRRRGALLAAPLCLGLAAIGVSAPAGAAAPEWAPPPSYTSSDQGDGTYSVPLLASDVPDVSVTMVPAAENDEGRDVYYMVSTTMHLSPGAPIMKSYDLVNWEIVNYVYDRLSINDAFSMRNGMNSYGAGQWASSLRYHDGTFYVAFNTNNMGGAFIYSTDDIENGAWDKIALGRGFHDMSLFFDEANGGTPYLIYGGGSAARLSDDLTTVVEEYPDIIDEDDYAGASWEGGLLEGAQVFYVDGQYYIVMISWPPGQGRQVVMFRSDTLLGKYATGDGSNPYESRVTLNSDGFAQGSLVPVTDDEGNLDWHGFFFRDTYPLGRIPGLIPAQWSDGWPVFGDEGAVTRGQVFDKLIDLDPADELFAQQQAIVTSDDFENDAPHKAYMDEAWDIPPGPDVDQSLLGVELVDNGGFEDGVEPWVVNDTAQVALTDAADAGEAALAVSGRTTTGSGPRQDVSADVQHGVTYDLTARVRYDNPDSPATKRFYVTARYANGTFTNLATGIVTRGEWGTLAGTFTIPDTQPLAGAAIFVETPWTSAPGSAPDEHLMDFSVDEVSLVGRPLTTVEPHEDEISFNGSRLAMEWEWNHAPDNRYWSLTDRPGWLTLTNGSVVTGDAVYSKATNRELAYLEEARNTLSQRTFGPQASVETAMDVSQMRDGDVAGLATYGRSFTYAAVRHEDGQNTLGIATRLQPFSDSFDQDAAEAFVAGSTVDLGDATVVHLKQDADFASPDGQLWVQFHYSLDGETWMPLGARQGPLVMDWSLSHFMGYRFGLFSYATEQVGGSVAFDHYLLSDTLSGEALDTSGLEAAIEYAEGLDAGDYPAEAWSDMTAALADAQMSLAGTPSTQNQIDAPRRALDYQLARLGTLVEEPAIEFIDVEGSEHAVAIGWLAAEGISTGWSTAAGQEFRPLAQIKRDAMAAFLYRYAGSPEVTLPAESPFVDVTPDSTEFYEEIVWMFQEGISTGWETSEGREFRPLAPVKRDAMAAFLYRYAGQPSWTDPGESPFVDVTASSTEFFTEITWLESTGITTGWSTPAGQEYRPLSYTKRDAMATFLYRFDQLDS